MTSTSIKFKSVSANNMMESNLEEDINEKEKHRLLSVEAFRSIATLQESIKKLDFLGSVTPDVMKHRDELSKFVGDEISRTLKEQRRLETRYEELIAQRAAFQKLVNKSKYKELQAEIQDISRALRESTKNLCRNLKDNPNINGNLIKIQRERNDLVGIIQCLIRDLQENGSYHLLIEKVRQDELAQKKHLSIIKREKETAEIVRRLEFDLRTEKEIHQQMVTEKKAQIADLKEKLQTTKYATTIDTKFARKECFAKTGCTARTHKQEEKELEQEIKRIMSKHEMEVLVHNKTADFLKGKTNKIIAQVAEWENKFETEYGKLEDEYTSLKNKRDATFAALEKLRARREKEIMDENQRLVELERQKEVERIQQEEEERQEHSAKVITSAVRDYFTRKKKLEEENKKGGKKKKKKK